MSNSGAIIQYPGYALDPAKHEIRLLQIHPAQFDSPLRCTLESFSLDRAAQGTVEIEVPSFEALSYTWGSSNNQYTIRLNDLPDFPVTDNLFAGLRRLRKCSESRRLWVDALCINQSNIAERNTQVARMASIYSQAGRVVVWLGDTSEPEEGPHIKLLEHREQQPLVSGHQWKLRTLRAVVEVGRAPWWSRTWVLQEFAVARVLPQVCFGCFEVSWDECQGLMLDLLNGDDQRWYERAWAPFYNMLGMRKAIGSDLAMLALLSCSTDATVAKDKVYALLGLMRDEQSAAIIPDYDEPVEDTFVRATYAAITTSRNLEILKVVSLCDRGGFDLPTWAVNFSYKNRGPGGSPGSAPEYLHRTSALNEHRGLAPPSRLKLSTDLRFLTLYGHTLDEVRAVASLPGPYTRPSIDDALPGVSRVVSSIESKAQYRWLSRVPQATLSALSTFQLASIRKRQRSGNSLGTSREWRATVLRESTNPFSWDPNTLVSELFWRWDQCFRHRPSQPARERADPTISAYNDYARMVGEHYDVFASGQGFLGLAPVGVQPADVVAMLHGSTDPVILRPHDNGVYTFHGFVHCHGIDRLAMDNLHSGQHREAGTFVLK